MLKYLLGIYFIFFTFSYLYPQSNVNQSQKLIFWAEALKTQSQKSNKFYDCSGFVRNVFIKAYNKDFLSEAYKEGIFKKVKSAGFLGKNRFGVIMLYILFRHKYTITTSPKVGDIVFFDNTYDKNKNQKWDDLLTHAGIITKIDEDGRCRFIHGGTSKGVVVGYFNLNYPNLYQKDGKVMNSYLQQKYQWNLEKPKLAGALIRSFGRYK